MTPLFFSKYHGNGNDFILVDDRRNLFSVENKPFIQKICHRNLGIGADGIILLRLSEKQDAKMVVLNSDGSVAESCGNGLSCLVRFMWDIGDQKENYSIEIGREVVFGKFNGKEVILQMQDPVIHEVDVPIPIKGKRVKCAYIDSGVPHAICFVDKVDAADVEKEGRALRFHPYFHPIGTNVNFAEVDGENNVKVRTYERGVEGETCSCGTGAVAVAAASGLKFNLSSPISIKFKYGAMGVSFKREQNLITNVELTNRVNYVFSGMLPLR